MKRKIDITVDLKTKNYNSILLKQLDTTELSIKILDNNILADLTDNSFNIIFTKPDNTIVSQNSNIDITKISESIITVILLEECLRLPGFAKVEIEIINNGRISSFYIPAIIEPSGLNNVESSNTPNYIEKMEQAVNNLTTNGENLIKGIQEDYDNIVLDVNTIRDNYDTLNTNISTKVDKIDDKQLSTEDYTTEEKTKLLDIEANANNYIHPNTHSLDVITETDNKKIMTVEERNKIIQHDKNNRFLIVTTEEIAENKDYIIPCNYLVNKNTLDIYFCGEKLVKNVHYKEVGADETVSKKIQFYDWGQSVPIRKNIRICSEG